EPYGALLQPALQAPSPSCTCCDPATWSDLHCAKKALDALERLLTEHAAEVAAVIIEPLCQAAAGMRFYPPQYLKGLRQACDRNDVLLIADEIAVGFGRTGRTFACDHASMVPDLLCLGKALTAGYLPMSALVVRDAVHDVFRGASHSSRVLWDGHTFCGNPITAAAAVAALEVYEKEQLPPAARMQLLRDGMHALEAHPAVAYQRSLGMIGMCAIKEEAGGAAYARGVCARALELGLFIRPLGEVLYLWPALNIEGGHLRQMFEILIDALDGKDGKA
ncbi:MAG: aminotransferase class III-fold pyridoxal phosphate-dependent enzyme, partial [Candidatus Hydrogenedentes bacterium]|nr:aminotransferase class III-fold pyridoxal phosphate-dependent enzyme [Candidatus Hydrogenedentota bacterium]